VKITRAGPRPRRATRRPGPRGDAPWGTPRATSRFMAAPLPRIERRACHRLDNLVLIRHNYLYNYWKLAYYQKSNIYGAGLMSRSFPGALILGALLAASAGAQAAPDGKQISAQGANGAPACVTC